MKATRYCGACYQHRPRSDYVQDKDQRDGLAGSCRECSQRRHFKKAQAARAAQIAKQNGLPPVTWAEEVEADLNRLADGWRYTHAPAQLRWAA